MVLEHESIFSMLSTTLCWKSVQTFAWKCMLSYYWLKPNICCTVLSMMHIRVNRPPTQLPSPLKFLGQGYTVLAQMSKHKSFGAKPKAPTDAASRLALMKRSRNITFEDFTIYVPNHAGHVTQLTKQQRDAISQLYPGTTCVSIMEPYLNILVEELPPKPWPISIAGMPAHITTDEWDFNHVHYHHRYGGAPVLTDVTFGSKDTKEILIQGIEAVRKCGVNMISMESWGRFVVCVLEEDPEDVKYLLPARIANIWTQYRQQGNSHTATPQKCLMPGVPSQMMVGTLVLRSLPNVGSLATFNMIEGIVMALVVTRTVVHDPEASEQYQHSYEKLIYWDRQSPLWAKDAEAVSALLVEKPIILYEIADVEAGQASGS